MKSAKSIQNVTTSPYTVTLHVKSQSSSRTNSHTTNSNLSITHTEHATACCGTTVSQPASQRAVTSCSTACPVLCCVLLFPIQHLSLQSNFSSPDTRASHGPMSSVAEVGWCLCDTYQMAMSACLCNDDAFNLRGIYGVFSLSVLDYSAKFRFVRTRALLWNPPLLLLQISVEVRFFVHTCLSGIHVLLAVFFVCSCALVFDLSTRTYFKRVHMYMSCYLRNHIVRPSFSVVRGTVGPVHLEISTLYCSHGIEPTQCILVYLSE
jgi:hypothetical protein